MGGGVPTNGGIPYEHPEYGGEPEHRKPHEDEGATRCRASNPRPGEAHPDLSHDPTVPPALRSALIDGSDLAIGARYVDGGGVRGWPWWCLVLSRGGSVYAGLILGLSQRDLTCGFKGWRGDTLEAIKVDDTRSDGNALQVETTYRARVAGARVTEVPITFTDRQRGSSKMGWSIVFKAGWYLG